MENIYAKRVSSLRKLMAERNLSAYIIFSGDDHGSEYVGEHFRSVRFISGFDGSAGTVIVLKDEAGLWTDGRYFIQAERQLGGSGIGLFKMGEPEVPEIEDFLLDKLPVGSLIGFDGTTESASYFQKTEKKLSDKKIAFVTDEDLIGKIWEDRPAVSHNAIWELPEKYRGRSRAEKLSEIRAYMKEKKADCHIISSLDSIAYLYNLRGSDIAYNPVFMAYSVIYEESAYLYCDPDALEDDLLETLNADKVYIKEYDGFLGDVSKIRGRVLADSKNINVRIWDILAKNSEKGVTIADERDPEILMKAVKTDAEIENIRESHVKDGAAVTKLIYWLKHHDDIESLTETAVSEKLISIRSGMEGYIGESFDPIIAEGAHGAIVHYSASEETDAHIEKNTFLLMDTGAQYSGGTTDITRTITTGDVSEEMKKHYTAVLKGHLRLSAAVFKECDGTNIDIFAREPLWELGLDYNHGTGHGVGYLLNVHEGPQSIRTKHLPTDEKIKPGMLTSDEPGLYIEGKYGIRTENLMLSVPFMKNSYGEFLTFEFVTMVPYDKSAIVFSDMTDRDIRILKEYYEKVREKISPYLTEAERAWLLEETDITQRS